MIKTNLFKFSLIFFPTLLLWTACGSPKPASEGKEEHRVRLLDGGSKSEATRSSDTRNTPPEPRTVPEKQSDASTPTDKTPVPDREPPPERRVNPEPRPEVRPPPDQQLPRAGWIGEDCVDPSMCFYKDPLCIKESQGWAGGTCSQTCSKYCPDKQGQPGTFCIAGQGLVSGNQGVCVQRCAYDRYKSTGCRTGYSCKVLSRHNEASTKAPVCVPQGTSGAALSGCYAQLLKQGLSFSIEPDPKAKPKGLPNLTCSVKDALKLAPTIHGVTWVTGSNKAAPMMMRCQFAQSIAEFSKYLHSQGVRKVMHYGTYNCRAIRNDSGSTGSLSQHGLGMAIDIAAFWKDNGQEYNLVKHWDHSTTWKNNKGQMGCWSTKFNSPQAKFLYDIACEMWKRRWFTLVLTPNYNKVHDNHFHVDLSSSGRIFATFPPVIQKHEGH